MKKSAGVGVGLAALMGLVLLAIQLLDGEHMNQHVFNLCIAMFVVSMVLITVIVFFWIVIDIDYQRHLPK